MTTIDKIEIEKFSKMAKDWWNPKGKFKPLHLFNPARIEFIKEKLISHFKLDPNSEKPLEKLKILDIGCGGGLLCEPLNRLGATITGIDASNDNIEVAKLHSKEMNLNIKYIHCSPEESKTSNSLSSKFLLIKSDFSFNSSVTPDIAETMTIIWWPSLNLFFMILATFLIFSMSPTLEPPNFMHNLFMI